MIMKGKEEAGTRRNANADFSSMNISASQNPEAGFQYSSIHFRSLSVTEFSQPTSSFLQQEVGEE